MGRLRIVWPLAVYLLAMAIVFRTWIVSGFDLGFGDRADGIIEISLLEHWRNVFAGTESWNQPLYFWPYRDTLGYNDGYLLFGIDYSVWRSMLDPFRADMADILVFKTIGFWAAWWLGRRCLSFDRGSSLLIALLFSISSGMMQQAGHAQLQSVALLPVAAMLAITTIRYEIAGRRGVARVMGGLLAALMASWLLTAYYMAWFTLYFTLVFGICWLVVNGTWRPAKFVVLVRNHGVTAITIVSALAIFCIPFLMVYLPKVSETGSHGLHEARPYLTWFYDIANAGEDNDLWGWTLHPLRLLFEHIRGVEMANDKLGGEHASGFPLVLLILIVTSIVALVKRGWPPVVRTLALTVAISWVSTLQAGPLSPWALVYGIVPGASGLRVVLRYQLFLELPALFLVAFAYRQRAGRLATRQPILAAAIVALLVVEQLAPVTAAALSRSRQSYLLRAPSPPSGCRNFYVVHGRPGEPRYRNRGMDALYPQNADAMLLAALWRVPTLNGYATFLPPDWAFADRSAADYDTRARRYIDAHRLRGACRFDAASARPWRRIT